VFELYLHYYPHRGYPSDIILLDTEARRHYAWIDYDLDLPVRPTIDGKPLTNGWTKIKTILLEGYVKASPLSFLILTGKDYYSTLPKGASDDQR